MATSPVRKPARPSQHHHLRGSRTHGQPFQRFTRRDDKFPQRLWLQGGGPSRRNENRLQNWKNWGSVSTTTDDAQCSKIGPYSICGQRWPRLTCEFAQADQCFICPCAESMDIIVYVDVQRMHKSDCMDAQADLNLRCSRMTKGPSSRRCASHFILG